MPSETTNERLLLSIDDLAEMLAMSGRSITRMCDRGEFPKPLALGKLRRWSKAAVDQWLSERESRGR